MKIISHRGYWKTTAEKNTPAAFARSFGLGYGTETDVRDRDGALVISHDMASAESLPVADFLHQAHDLCEPLALNIKADGLAAALAAQFAGSNLDWFAFDMSVPDLRAHLNQGNPVFGRMSEVEPAPPWLDELSGIWLDSFHSNWFEPALIERLLGQGLRVCVVSSELHGRPQLPLWALLKPLSTHPRLIMCTDCPVDAREFFERS